MPYSDPNLTHNPSTGAVAPSAWGDVIRDDLEFLIDPPVCSVFNSAAQSVATNTVTVMTANSESFDNDAMHSTVSNTSRITIQTAGRYLFIATVSFADTSVASSNARVEFRVSGVTQNPGRIIIAHAKAGNTTEITTSMTRSLAAAAYVELAVGHNVGANLDITLFELAALFLTR